MMLVYVDTSVFGGVFDKEFEQASGAFFDRVRDGALEVLYLRVPALAADVDAKNEYYQHF